MIIYLRGKIVCGKCGLTYGATKRGDDSYYFCHGRKDKAIGCDNGQFSTRVLDEYVWQTLMIYGPNLYSYLKDKSSNEQSISEKHGQIEYYTKQIQEQEKIRKRINTMFKEGYIDEDEYKKEQNGLRKVVQEAENKIGILNRELELFASGEYQKIKDDFTSLVHEDNLQIRKAFIERYISRIVLTKTDFDFNGLESFKYVNGKLVRKVLEGVRPDEKTIRVDLFLQGREEPVPVFLSGKTEQYYVPKNVRTGLFKI
jgi:hypothetical protein